MEEVQFAGLLAVDQDGGAAVGGRHHQVHARPAESQPQPVLGGIRAGDTVPHFAVPALALEDNAFAAMILDEFADIEAAHPVNPAPGRRVVSEMPLVQQGHQGFAFRVQVDIVAQQIAGLQVVGPQVVQPFVADLDEFNPVRSRQPAERHAFGGLAGGIRLLVGIDVLGADDDIRGGFGTQFAEQSLPGLGGALVGAEQHQIRLPPQDVVLEQLLHPEDKPAPDGAVLGHDRRPRVPLAQALDQQAGPIAFDGLAREDDPDRTVRVFPGLQQRHGAAQIGAQMLGVLRRRRGRDLLAQGTSF